MPKALSYRANSVIYFQGDQADRVFILQKGKVSLNYQDIETGQEIHEYIQTGEFFGVKSALGKYPREENALVLQDATVLFFSVPEYEQFACQNTRIIMKMLKVFSNQLRRVQKQVENLLEKEEEASPEGGLFKNGEYYLRNRQYNEANYVFSRYLTYYPSGRYAREAARNIELAEASLQKYGQGKGPQPNFQSVASQAAPQSRAQMMGQSPGRGFSPSPEAAEAPKAAPAAKPSDLTATATQYYNAVGLFSQEKYKEAFLEFKKIIDANEEEEYVAKSVFEQARCVFLLGQLDQALALFTKLFQTYPKHPDLLDVLYYMGQIHEKKGDKAKAGGFYKKILSMQQDEDDSTRIKARKALKAIEG